MGERIVRMQDTLGRFGLVSILLHWVVAVAIIALLVIAHTGIDQPRGPERSFWANMHVSIAVVALPFILYRIWWRMKNGKPKSPDYNPILMKIASIVWRALLVLMVLQYFSGPVMVWIHQHPLDIFGLTAIPIPGGEFWLSIEDSYPVFQLAHQTVGWTIIGALFLHIGGALKHLIIDRDGVAERMFIPPRDDGDVQDPANVNLEGTAPQAGGGA